MEVYKHMVMIQYTKLKMCGTEITHICRYKSEEKIWKVKNMKNMHSDYIKSKDNVWGSCSSPEDTLLLGTHRWTIHNDSLCSNNESYTAYLTLTGCNISEFTCRDGSCVPMENRCDGRTECNDETDEDECSLVAHAPTYKKRIDPPPLKPQERKALVNFSINLKDIFAIDEVGRRFEIHYDMICEWFDPRLVFHNLKKEREINKLSLQEKTTIWNPKIEFVNTKFQDESIVDSKLRIEVVPNEQFNYTISDDTVPNNIYIFDGENNMLESHRSYTTDFICEFQMFWYPFDTQHCELNFTLQANLDKLHLI